MDTGCSKGEGEKEKLKEEKERETNQKNDMYIYLNIYQEHSGFIHRIDFCRVMHVFSVIPKKIYIQIRILKIS